MDIVLKIIGGCTLVVFLLITIGLSVARYRIRKAFQGLGDLVGEGLNVSTPGIITLTSQANLQWRADEILDEVTEAFGDEGFQRIGDFGAEEMPGLYLRAFFHQAKGAYGVHYEHPAGPNWQDIYAEFDSGQNLTITNAPQGEEVDSPPWAVKQYDDGAEVDDLVEMFDSHPNKGTPNPVSAERFVPTFQSAYRRSMEWRAARGGASAEEIQRIAALSGNDLSDADMKAMLEFGHQEALGQLETQLRRRLLESGVVSALDWDRIQNRLLIVHDSMNHEDLCGALSRLRSSFLDPEDPQWATPEELPPRERFLLLTARLSPVPTTRKVWETDQPVPADFYEIEPIWDGLDDDDHQEE